MCISNDVISFNKESFVFLRFDENSDLANPVLKEDPIVFSHVDMADDSSFHLIVLVEIKKRDEFFAFQIYGMNVIPITTHSTPY